MVIATGHDMDAVNDPKPKSNRIPVRYPAGHCMTLETNR
jgi:hypothetical protein